MIPSEKHRKLLAVNQIVESGRWEPVDALGREVEREDWEHVEFLACKTCGKQYKWNQASWMVKHQAEHSEEEKKESTETLPAQPNSESRHAREFPDIDKMELRDVYELQWKILERLDQLVEKEQRRERA